MAICKIVHAYILVGRGRIKEKPGALIAESLDSFPAALFFTIFSVRISKLFLPKSNTVHVYELAWLKIDHFSQLKLIL